ncbi:MAG: hypothetical protein II857_13075 [Selenomonadaceae bacterium]|nr:hypothetical protein [Selenomonadaceae bacterium]
MTRKLEPELFAHSRAMMFNLSFPTTFMRGFFYLDEPYRDCTGQIAKLMQNGQLVFVYGIYYPDESGTKFDAATIQSSTC